MRIYLDDERQCPINMTVARNAHEFEELVLNNHDSITEISFDHDLGQASNKTGYDCAKWLVDQTINGVIDLSSLKVIFIHSANPVGAENIIGYFRGAYNAGVFPDVRLVRISSLL